jgi:hypothetical protein
VTGLYEYDAGTNSVVVPGWFAEHVLRMVEEGDTRPAVLDYAGRLRRVPEPPYLLDIEVSPAPPECDFHPVLHDLAEPVAPPLFDPPPPGLAGRMRARVRAALG